MERSVPWSELPPELLSMIWSMITEKLDTEMGVVRFRSVCSSWRSSTPPVSELELRIGGAHIYQRRVYLLEPPPPTSPEDESRCPPSREGWLIKIAEDVDGGLRGRGGRVRLINPLSSQPILFKGGNFPKVLCTLDYRVTEIFVERYLIGENSYYGGARKVIMLPDSPWAVLEETLAVGIFEKGKLACWKHGDKDWYAIGNSRCQYDDLIAYKGQFYVVDRFGIVWWIDLSSKVVQFSRPVCSGGNGGDRNYLVESGGDLYVVGRYFDESQFSGIRAGALREAADFKVYRLNQEWGKWDEIRNLGDVALFMGNHSCFSVSVKVFGGCKGNCIYFTVFDETPGGKVKVFDMEDRCIQRASDLPDRLRILWPPPAWIAPNGVALSPYSLKEPLF